MTKTDEDRCGEQRSMHVNERPTRSWPCWARPGASRIMRSVNTRKPRRVPTFRRGLRIICAPH